MKSSRHRIKATSALLLAAFILFPLFPAATACAAGKTVYEVRAGDSLIRIARRLGITLGELQQDNKLTSDLIVVGQELEIRRAFHKHEKKRDLKWSRPVAKFGAVLLGFGSQQNAQGVKIPHTGINISVDAATRLICPADGVVRYVGLQDGFGVLVIIIHAGGYSTVLAPLDPNRVEVEVGRVVLRGDTLGCAGEPVEHDEHYVHIELRRHSAAIKPGRLLR